MNLIQITEFIPRTEAEKIFEKYYDGKENFFILQKKIYSGDYSLYAIARLPRTNEVIPIGFEINSEAQTQKFIIKIFR